VEVRRIEIIIRKEASSILRERRLLIILAIQPVLLISIIGYAFSGGLRDLQVGVIDDDFSRDSVSLINKISSSNIFRVKYLIATEDEGIELIRRGELSAVIHIPKFFGDNGVEIFVDETNINFAEKVVGYLRGVVGEEAKVKYNPVFTTGTRLIDFIAPSVVAVVIQVVGLLLALFSISKEKEEGTLEMLVVTPTKYSEIVLGKFLFITTALLVELFVAMVIVHSLFDVRINGDVIVLFLTQILSFTSMVGLGLLISTLSETQLQGIQIGMLLVITNIFISGFIYPLEAMPELAKIIAYLLPLTHANIAFGSIVIMGNGIDMVYPQLLVLVLYTILPLLLSVLILRRKIGGANQ